MKLKRKFLNLFAKRNKKYKGDTSVGEDTDYELIYQSMAFENSDKSFVEKMINITIENTLSDGVFMNEMSKISSLLHKFGIRHIITFNSTMIYVIIIGTDESFTNLKVYNESDDIKLLNILFDVESIFVDVTSKSIQDKLNLSFLPKRQISDYELKKEPDNIFDIIEITHPKELIVKEVMLILNITFAIKQNDYIRIFGQSKLNWVKFHHWVSHDILIVNMNLFEFMCTINESEDFVIDCLYKQCFLDDEFYLFNINDIKYHLIQDANFLFDADLSNIRPTSEDKEPIYYKDIDEII